MMLLLSLFSAAAAVPLVVRTSKCLSIYELL